MWKWVKLNGLHDQINGHNSKSGNNPYREAMKHMKNVHLTEAQFERMVDLRGDRNSSNYQPYVKDSSEQAPTSENLPHSFSSIGSNTSTGGTTSSPSQSPRCGPESSVPS